MSGDGSSGKEGVPAGQRGAGCEETGELAEGKKEQTTSLVVATLHSPAASWLVITPAPSPPSGSQLIRISCDVICHVQNKCQHLTYLWFAQTLLTYLGRFKHKNHVRVLKKKSCFALKCSWKSPVVLLKKHLRISPQIWHQIKKVLSISDGLEQRFCTWQPPPPNEKVSSYKCNLNRLTSCDMLENSIETYPRLAQMYITNIFLRWLD